jgi:hypothetical protein
MANLGKRTLEGGLVEFQVSSCTSKACLKVGKTGKGLVGYVASNHAANLDKRRFLTGYVFIVGDYVVS